MAVEGASEDYSHLELFEREHWTVGLHPKQTYLGRGVAVLKRELEDPLECRREERDELWEDVFPEYQRILVEVFEPVRINYGHLANEFKQVHWHLIPRYEDPSVREFRGIEFEDERPGRNYAPHPSVPEGVTEDLIQEIRAELRARLSK